MQIIAPGSLDGLKEVLIDAHFVVHAVEENELAEKLDMWIHWLESMPDYGR